MPQTSPQVANGGAFVTYQPMPLPLVNRNATLILGECLLIFLLRWLTLITTKLLKISLAKILCMWLLNYLLKQRMIIGALLSMCRFLHQLFNLVCNTFIKAFSLLILECHLFHIFTLGHHMLKLPILGDTLLILVWWMFLKVLRLLLKFLLKALNFILLKVLNFFSMLIRHSQIQIWTSLLLTTNCWTNV